MKRDLWLAPLVGSFLLFHLGEAEAAPAKKKAKVEAKADADAEADAAPATDASDDEGVAEAAPEETEPAQSEPEGPVLLDTDSDADAGGDVASVGGGAAVGSGMKGRVGLLGTRTISGLNGVSLRFYALDKLTVGLTAGFAVFTHKEEDENGEFGQSNTVGLFGAGPSLFFWPYQGDRNKVVYADFGVGMRTLVYLGFTGANDEDVEDTLNDPIEVDIEIPVSTQVWFGKRVSVAPEFGLAVRIIPGNREPDENGAFDTNPGTGVGERLGTTNGPGLGVELGSTSGVFLGLNVGYYFGKTK